jgi:glycosyltransferase involved in cell wall biosynthesis
MKVLQLATYDGGQGAARATLRLHRALRDVGIQSTLRVAQANSGDPWVRAPRGKPRQALALLRSSASWWLQKPQHSANPVTHSVAALPSWLDRELNTTGADLLHLHWVQDEFLSVEAIGRLNGPLIWTLHDSWAFCGSEHYPASISDQRFREGYERCNRPLGDRGLDLDRWTWRRKRRAWASLLPRLQLIAPSHWMAEQAAASALLAGVPCAVIPNALPSVFRPILRAQARALLDWPQGRRLLLFGAIGGAEDARKGLDLLAAALARLAGERCDLETVLLGQSTPAQGLALPCRNLGRFHDDLSLALAYAAADVVVVPSRLDNLPQAASEALACGTPVVAFRQGGMADLIDHRRNGYLADPFDPVDLARGVAWCLDSPGLVTSPSRLQSWSPAAVAVAHRELYLQVLQR